MKRYFDARSTPVNEQILQAVNKVPSGGGRLGEEEQLKAGAIPGAAARAASFFKKKVISQAKTQAQIDSEKKASNDRFNEQKFGHKNLRSGTNKLSLAEQVGQNPRLLPKPDGPAGMIPYQHNRVEFKSVLDDLGSLYKKEVEAAEAQKQSEKKRVLKVLKPSEKKQKALEFLRSSSQVAVHRQQSNAERQELTRLAIEEMRGKIKSNA
jgi:hypothetical protein